MDSYPHPDLIAHAIVAACKETGADPVAVASGERDGDCYYSVSRARAYAATAIRAVWQGCGNMAIARMFGASSPSCYFASLEARRSKGLSWWSARALERVVTAIPYRKSRLLRQGENGPLTMRRAPVDNAADVTGSFMGDPQPGRSALDQKRAAT